VHPGRSAVDPTHWVFPVLTENPNALVARLRSNGFDAARATSGIGVVRAPDDRPDVRPIEARRLVSSVVFLPAYPELSSGELERMLEVLR
jgi:dTDP-4-amino-4,6-dideoxygalactose transaminase